MTDENVQAENVQAENVQAKVDFNDAHDRHWSDAELLYEQQRWANADHLYGMSAECGLKAVMIGLGLPTDDEGSPAGQKYRTHVNILWPLFLTFAEGHQGADYAQLLGGDNKFQDWYVAQRYEHREHFDEKLAKAHREGAKQVRHVVDKAKLDGILE